MSGQGWEGIGDGVRQRLWWSRLDVSRFELGIGASHILSQPLPTRTDPIPYPLPSLPGHQVSSVSHQLDNGAWSAECTQVGKVRLDTVDHIVRRTAIQHSGKCTISYVCRRVESFRPQGLWQS